MKRVAAPLRSPAQAGQSVDISNESWNQLQKYIFKWYPVLKNSLAGNKPALNPSEEFLPYHMMSYEPVVDLLSKRASVIAGWCYHFSRGWNLKLLIW